MRFITVVLVTAVVLTGCSHKNNSDSPVINPSPSVSQSTETLLITVRTDERHGTFLVDGSGRPLYTYVGDKGENSECEVRCGDDFMPVPDKDFIVGSNGVDESLIGVNGKGQVLYNGRPLYYNTNDTFPNPFVDDLEEFPLIRPNGTTIKVI